MNTRKALSSFLLGVYLVLTPIIGKAQYKPKLADTFLAKLQKQGIDTILIHMTGCGECTRFESKPNCDCSLSDVIQTVHFIYLKNGKAYKFNLSCCREDFINNDTTSTGIPYFISLKEMFRRKDVFYKNLSKNKKFIAPIPTDNPFDDVELIIGKKHINFTSYDYQRNRGYIIWKGYF